MKKPVLGWVIVAMLGAGCAQADTIAVHTTYFDGEYAAIKLEGKSPKRCGARNPGYGEILAIERGYVRLARGCWFVTSEGQVVFDAVTPTRNIRLTYSLDDFTTNGNFKGWYPFVGY